MTRFLLDNEAQDAPFDSSEGGWFRNPKIIFALVATLIFAGSTFAGQLIIRSGGIEYGQGLFKVRACDTWISIGLYPTPANYDGLSRVQAVELVGLNPEKCAGKLLRLKFYGNSGNLLNLYVGTVAAEPSSGTSTPAVDSATTLTVYDTSTAWNQATTTYANYAAKALTLINQAGFNIGYYDDYLSITYNKKTGGYKIFLNEPLCLMSDVYDITIESAPLGGS
jgi:hypothetical protein